MLGQTFAVAITRWSQPLQTIVQQLAPAFGMTPYDLRAKLSGPIPVVFEHTNDPRRAQELRELFRSQGHGAVVCDVSKVTPSAAMVSPRQFQFGPAEFFAFDQAQGRHQMPYDQVTALVWARHVSTEIVENASTMTKFSPGRALTGRLTMTHQVTHKTKTDEADHEQVLYVFHASGQGHMILRETSMLYDGLGPAKEPARAANFRAVVELLRQRTPQAIFDARLLTNPLRRSLFDAQDDSSGSNIGATDLAAQVLVIARLQHQL